MQAFWARRAGGGGRWRHAAPRHGALDTQPAAYPPSHAVAPPFNSWALHMCCTAVALLQDEPAYCGLASLAMTLNTLNIDPRRTWKGPWRW